MDCGYSAQNSSVSLRNSDPVVGFGFYGSFLALVFWSHHLACMSLIKYYAFGSYNLILGGRYILDADAKLESCNLKTSFMANCLKHHSACSYRKQRLPNKCTLLHMVPVHKITLTCSMLLVSCLLVGVASTKTSFNIGIVHTFIIPASIFILIHN